MMTARIALSACLVAVTSAKVLYKECVAKTPHFHHYMRTCQHAHLWLCVSHHFITKQNNSKKT